MALFDKKPLVFYLSSRALVSFGETNNKENLTFSPSNIAYGEIIDEKKHKEELQKFIERLKIKEGKGVLVLSHELVFFKEIKAPFKNEKEEIENFLAKIPLERANIAVVSPRNATRLQILASNRRFYEVNVKVFENNGIKIFSVVPAAVVDAKNIFKEKKIIEKYNFLEGKKYPETNKTIVQADSGGQDEEKKNMKKQYILLVVSLLLLTSAIGYLLFWLKK